MLEYGFRPNNPTVPLADPIVADNGVDPTQPTADARGARARGARSASSTRGPSCARTPACCSCSTSRGRWARSSTDDGKTRLDLAQEAAVGALDQFKATDDVGLWVFSTDLGGADPNVRELVPVGPIGENKTRNRQAIEAQFPTERHAAVRRHREGVHDDAR